jgi:adenosylmethionine-8-amino-7-oxononanoate aminotransferase
MALGGVDIFNRRFKELFLKSFKVPSPYCYRCPLGKTESCCDTECVKPLEELLEKKANRIAAVILEPLVMAAGGMIIYPGKYLVRAARACNKYGVHLILDEVATGFGRTGKMFASDHVGIKADFLCLSKGITAGYLPLGATLTTERVYKAFYSDYENMKTFFHGHTYTANPISCSCALASLDIFEKENTLGRLKETMPVFHRLLERFRPLPIVGDVRYIGMIGAIELVKDKSTKEGFGMKDRIGLKIYKKALERSLILRPLGDVIYFFLPLCIEKDDIECILRDAYDLISQLN